jgi:hypothetical protein
MSQALVDMDGRAATPHEQMKKGENSAYKENIQTPQLTRWHTLLLTGPQERFHFLHKSVAETRTHHPAKLITNCTTEQPATHDPVTQCHLMRCQCENNNTIIQCSIELDWHAQWF